MTYLQQRRTFHQPVYLREGKIQRKRNWRGVNTEQRIEKYEEQNNIKTNNIIEILCDQKLWQHSTSFSGQVNKSVECLIYAVAETPEFIDSPSHGTSYSIVLYLVIFEIFEKFLSFEWHIIFVSKKKWTKISKNNFCHQMSVLF